MGHRCGELDMAHALATHLRQRDLDAAFLADDALVLHSLVLAAQAFIVLDRTEDARAEEPVPFRLEGTVVDGLGLLDFAVRPRQNLLGRCNADANLVECLGGSRRVEDVHDLLVHGSLVSFLREPCSTPLMSSKIFGPNGALTGRIAARPIHSPGTAAGPFCSSTFSPRERISLTRTLKLS